MRDASGEFTTKEIHMGIFKTEHSRRTFVTGNLVGMVALAANMASAQDQNSAQPMESTIRVGTNTTTLVNVFTVEPEAQQRLVDVLKEGTDEFFSKAPGFISSSVLKSQDGRRVINYSQWDNAKDVAAFRKDPYFGAYIQRLKALSKAESIECEVVYVNHV
jgi:heme-degrading monooxygenase HmoA